MDATYCGLNSTAISDSTFWSVTAGEVCLNSLNYMHTTIILYHYMRSCVFQWDGEAGQ